MERKIVHRLILVLCTVIASFTNAEKFTFIESVWKPDLLFEFLVSKKPVESSESFHRNGL